MASDPSGENGAYRHGGDLDGAARRYGLPAEGFLDFSANLNPLGPPPAVLQALRNGLEGIGRYPDPEAGAFRQALAARLKVPVAAVRALNGAAEGFLLLLQYWRPRRVIIPVPAFAEYERAARALGAEVLRVPLPADRAARRYRLDPEAVESALVPETALVLANPNNPTGHALGPAVLARLYSRIREAGSRLLLDEAFIDFLPDAESRSLCRTAAGDPHLAVIGSLTKLFALPGLRLGFVAGTPELLAGLDRLRQPWPVNRLALAAGEAALREGGEHAVRTRRCIGEERARLTERLSGLSGVTVWEGSANFLLLEFQPPWPAASVLSDRLGREGILIRDASNFPGLTPYHIRIAVRRREENQRLVDALERIAAETGSVR